MKEKIGAAFFRNVPYLFIYMRRFQFANVFTRNFQIFIKSRRRKASNRRDSQRFVPENVRTDYLTPARAGSRQLGQSDSLQETCRTDILTSLEDIASFGKNDQKNGSRSRISLRARSDNLLRRVRPAKTARLDHAFGVLGTTTVVPPPRSERSKGALSAHEPPVKSGKSIGCEPCVTDHRLSGVTALHVAPS